MQPKQQVFEIAKDQQTVAAMKQPEYLPLPVLSVPGPEGMKVSRWEFTDEERAIVAAGGDLFLNMMTFNDPLTPIFMTVANPQHQAEELGVLSALGFDIQHHE